jgi:protoporphyrinogen oxidase
MTKTPEVRYHDKSCLYRVLNEAIEVLDATRTNSPARETQFESWFALHFGSSDVASLKPMLRQTWNAALDRLAAKVAAVSDDPQSPPAFHSAITAPIQSGNSE